MVILQTVEIPGLREAIKRESHVRDTAFLDGLEIVCGVEVVPMSLRRLIWLEQARNGFIVSCRFESDDEYLSHALQVIYFCTPGFNVPRTPKTGFWTLFREGRRQHGFFRKALRAGTTEFVIKEIESWLSDAFMDSPAGSGSNEIQAPSYASYPAFVVDKFAEAGLPFTYEEIMDMPLRRLWQHWRIATRRVDEISLSNPSDDLATKVIAGVS